jgi:hypothetical protein
VLAKVAWFEKSLEVMDQCHHALVVRVPPPERITKDLGYVFRYREQTLHQALIQKLARIVTGVRSSHVLIGSGFLQEASIIQRTVDEAQEDTLFLVYGRITDNWTALHDKYLQNFWHDSPLSSVAVRRPQIRDYIAGMEGKLTGASTSEALRPLKDIYSLYSGYAHCASAHVMELVDGNPPAWQLNGSLGSDFQKDQFFDVRNQHYRGLIEFACSALLFDDKSMFEQVMKFADSFMANTNS